MNSTTFRNASGLPNDEQVTTARDMAMLAQHLIHDYPEYYAVFETQYFAYNGASYRNHNHLLFGYKGTDGIKTGYTRASGFNLTASVHRDDKHLIAVVLGGRTGGQRDAAMRALLDKHFPQALVGAPSAPTLVGPGAAALPPSTRRRDQTGSSPLPRQRPRGYRPGKAPSPATPTAPRKPSFQPDRPEPRRSLAQ